MLANRSLGDFYPRIQGSQLSKMKSLPNVQTQLVLIKNRVLGEFTEIMEFAFNFGHFYPIVNLYCFDTDW